MRTTTRSNIAFYRYYWCELVMFRRSRVSQISHSLPRHMWPNSSALPPFSKRCDNTATTPVFFINFKAQMTKGMAARAGFFPEFLGSNHKGNGGIRRRRGPCRPFGGRQAPPFFLKPILSYSSVYSSSSSAGSRPLTPTAPNLSFIKSRKKFARTFLISRALWNPQT